MNDDKTNEEKLKQTLEGLIEVSHHFLAKMDEVDIERIKMCLAMVSMTLGYIEDLKKVDDTWFNIKFKRRPHQDVVKHFMEEINYQFEVFEEIEKYVSIDESLTNEKKKLMKQVEDYQAWFLLN